jgi:hypothetical protein
MKRSFSISVLAACSLLLATACKKESLMTYDADNNIYFHFQIGVDPIRYSDSVIVTFAFSSPSVQDTIIHVPVVVTGVAADHDRSYSLTADAGSTAVASTDYVLPSAFVLRAGRTSDTLGVKFKRTAAIKTASVFLKLRLKENDQFRTQIAYQSRNQYDINYISPGDTISVQTFKIIVSDKLEAGPYWDNYHYYFGDFSEKKVRLMNQIIGMPLDWWSVDLYISQAQQANTTYYGGFTYRYLSDQAFAGNIIFEDDGVTPMSMGTYFTN